MGPSGMKPFFTYYGGKWRIADRYQDSDHGVIVEPFAGSAGFSVRRANGRGVRLYDADETVIGTWQYLIRAPGEEIRALPLYDGSWESVSDLSIPQEAKWLIGWWLNKGASSPRLSPSRWMRDGIRPKSFWGQEIRERLARQSGRISHWTASCVSYEDVPAVAATWFVDPPYQSAGKHYRMGPAGIDYGRLADWCQGLPGHVVVCENEGADWLPFKPFHEAKGTPGKHGGGRSAEVVWYGNEGWNHEQ